MPTTAHCARQRIDRSPERSDADGGPAGETDHGETTARILGATRCRYQVWTQLGPVRVIQKGASGPPHAILALPTFLTTLAVFVRQRDAQRDAGHLGGRFGTPGLVWRAARQMRFSDFVGFNRRAIRVLHARRQGKYCHAAAGPGGER